MATFSENGAKERLLALFTQELFVVVRAFASHGYEVRIVGGAVRDILKQECVDSEQLDKPNDIDLATDCPPDQMLLVCEEAGLHCKIMHSGALTTVIVWVPVDTAADSSTFSPNNKPTELKAEFELTALRGGSAGASSVSASTNVWELDASQRDFTINAMSCGVTPDGKDVRVYDYFGGEEHLSLRKVCFVGDMELNIARSPDRMLRYFRFHGEITAQTQSIGGGRIHDEQVLNELARLYTLYGHNIHVEVKWINVKKIICSSLHSIEHEIAVMDRIGILSPLLGLNDMMKTGGGGGGGGGKLDDGEMSVSLFTQTAAAVGEFPLRLAIAVLKHQFENVNNVFIASNSNNSNNNKILKSSIIDPVTIVVVLLNFNGDLITKVIKQLKWSVREQALSRFLISLCEGLFFF
jgi:hypothetical protein